MSNSIIIHSKFVLFYLIIANIFLSVIFLYPELNHLGLSFIGMLVLSFPVGFLSIHYFKKNSYPISIIISTSIVFGFVLKKAGAVLGVN